MYFQYVLWALDVQPSFATLLWASATFRLTRTALVVNRVILLICSDGK